MEKFKEMWDDNPFVALMLIFCIVFLLQVIVFLIRSIVNLFGGL
jgi:hypothetical protein